MFVRDITTSTKSKPSPRKKQSDVVIPKMQTPVESKRAPEISSRRTKTTTTKPKRKKGLRPSLSDQLKSIGENAGKLTAQLRSRGGMDSQQAILRSPSRDFRVGKLRSRYPSPVEFMEDHVKFSFHHPYERKVINMVMYYTDMALVSVQRLRREFSFKVHKKLEHFGKDYDANDRSHFITIVFNSESDVNRLRKEVMPKIYRVCKSRK